MGKEVASVPTLFLASPDRVEVSIPFHYVTATTVEGIFSGQFLYVSRSGRHDQ